MDMGRISDQSHALVATVNYDFTRPRQYDSSVINYDHKVFIRLTTDVYCKYFSSHFESRVVVMTL